MRVPLSFPVFVVAVFSLASQSARAQALPDSARLPRPAAVSQLAFEKTTRCAQPFGMHEGQFFEYQLLDGRGKPAGTWRYRVVKIKQDSVAVKKKKPVAITTVLLKSGLYDLSNRVLAQQDLTHFCRNDTTFTDGLAYINYESLKSFRGRRLAYQATPLAWPTQPTAGTSLAEGGVAIQVSSPSVAIAKVRTVVRQRTVMPGTTLITVPAGTFSCYTVEGQQEASTAARADLVFRNNGREVCYYDPAVGIVKTELYDKNRKLVQTKVLTKH
ncbi:TapB family protein [Hymenobacter arizonensis]|uniref:DUF3108 domain-containing protein n=1 Tax=Hymenobacter arizonensis TaxID=1227077 RepID=A0A1I5TP83_HYMAR|nr:hypothetical protein [Hymenobacter arizonensis]SFP84892.1 hypothetical protein SAMN04515668_0550 [Hymenobacter arizonensis]